MAKLQQNLATWTQANLISPDQAKNILDFEATRPTNNRLLYSFIALGTGVIGIGIISIVAANWDKISDAVKLGSDLFIMLALATSLWHQRNQTPGIIWEMLLTLFAAACLASQGLISQIYHIQGTLDQALLLWVVMTLPVITLAKRGFLPFIWTSALLGAASYRFISSSWLPLSFDGRWLLIGYALPMVCALVAMFLRRRVWAHPFTNTFREWALLGAVALIGVVDFSSMMDNETFFHWHQSMTWTGLLLGGAVLLAIQFQANWTFKVKSLISLMVFLYLLMPATVVGWQLSHWFAAPFTLALFTLAAVYLVWEGALWMANRLILLLGLRFLLLFFTAFGGLMDTGIGLILSGLIILLVIWLWMKLRNKLLNWMEGLAS